jgi:large subunit ribosomal protein L25
MSSFNLKAAVRADIGTTDSKRIRRAGQTPAVIYGKNGNNTNIAVETKELERQYFKGNIFTNVVELELDGKKLQTIAHKIDLHPVSDKPTHIDFVQFAKGEEVKVKTRIKFINHEKSLGLKRGGFLHTVLRKVEVVCKADEIPHEIEVDLSGLVVGDKIRSDVLTLPNGVKLAKKSSFLIASLVGRGGKATEDGAESTEAGEGEAEGENKEEAK